jgi:hypothetical protein
MVATLTREVIVLNEKISEIDRQTEASFRDHKQAAIVASMPSSGDLRRPGTGSPGLAQGQRQSSPPEAIPPTSATGPVPCSHE